MLDAVFSINATYTSTVNVCHRYADHAALEHRLHPAGEPRPAGEQPIAEFAQQAADLGYEELASQVLRNRGRTSPRGGILKAEAAARYAEVLVAHGIDNLDDVQKLLTDAEHLKAVETDLAQVPGHGGSGVRLGHLWMLAGDDDRIKPDRFVLRWLGHVLGAPPTAVRARELVTVAARRLGCTAWELDHAIWSHERCRTH